MNDPFALYRQSLHFRHANSEDAEAIASLHTASWQRNYRGILSDNYLDGDLARDHLKKWRERCEHVDRQDQRPSPFIWLALRENHQARSSNDIVGMSCAILDDHPQWGTLLDNLHVHPSAKRKGLGRRLLTDTAKWVRNQKRSRLHLTVLAQNHAAIAFYDAMQGQPVAHETVTSPDNSSTPVIRYLWDVNDLAARAS